MSHITADHVLESVTATAGTGAFTLAGALIGFRTFGAVMANGDTCDYAAWAVDPATGQPTGQWEVGEGTWNTGGTLSRTTLLASSTGSAINFAAGTLYVGLTLAASRTAQIQPDLAVKFPQIVNEPSTPAAGFMLLYGKDIAGIGRFRFLNPQGLDFTVQAAMMYNRFEMCIGGLATPGIVGGFVATVAGNAVGAAMATTNLATAILHTIFATTASAGTIGSMVNGILRMWRGNAAGQGGFQWVTRFSLLALQTGMRCFVGIADSVTALTNATLLNTSTTPGRIGLCINASTGNWDLIHTATGVTPTIIGLGANFPVNVTDVLELELACAPNVSTIGYRVRNLSTGASTSGTLSTNLPSSTTFMCPSLAICNNAQTAIASMRFYQWVRESDN